MDFSENLLEPKNPERCTKTSPDLDVSHCTLAAGKGFAALVTGEIPPRPLGTLRLSTVDRLSVDPAAVGRPEPHLALRITFEFGGLFEWLCLVLSVSCRCLLAVHCQRRSRLFSSALGPWRTDYGPWLS